MVPITTSQYDESNPTCDIAVVCSKKQRIWVACKWCKKCSLMYAILNNPGDDKNQHQTMTAKPIAKMDTNTPEMDYLLEIYGMGNAANVSSLLIFETLKIKYLPTSTCKFKIRIMSWNCTCTKAHFSPK